MVDNTLNKIINKKKQKLNELKKIISIESLKKKLGRITLLLISKKKLKIILPIIKYRLSQRLKKRALLLV